MLDDVSIKRGQGQCAPWRVRKWSACCRRSRRRRSLWQTSLWVAAPWAPARTVLDHEVGRWVKPVVEDLAVSGSICPALAHLRPEDVPPYAPVRLSRRQGARPGRAPRELIALLREILVAELLPVGWRQKSLSEARSRTCRGRGSRTSSRTVSSGQPRFAGAPMMDTGFRASAHRQTSAVPDRQRRTASETCRVSHGRVAVGCAR